MQVNQKYSTNVYALYSYNLGVNITFGSENIILDDVSIVAITNMGITLKNYGAGNVTIVNIYASPNGVDYFLLNGNVFGAVIGSGTIKHSEFTGVSLFLRVTVQCDNNASIDVHLHGNLT